MNRNALIQSAGRAFPYFGHKKKYIDRYPVPRYGHIIEPFAGGAGYALRYADLKVTLYELDQNVCELWDYLIRASVDDIKSLPLIEPNQSLDNLNISNGARQLIARWLNPLSGQPASKMPPCLASAHDHNDSRVWGEARKHKLITLSQRIKHWKIINSSFMDALNQYATWFIDPPYASKLSDAYKCTHKDIDYEYLALWCNERKGQAIVCENIASPKWLPFRKLADIKGGQHINGRLKRSIEVIWCSDERDWPMTQSSLL